MKSYLLVFAMFGCLSIGVLAQKPYKLTYDKDSSEIMIGEQWDMDFPYCIASSYFTEQRKIKCKFSFSEFELEQMLNKKFIPSYLNENPPLGIRGFWIDIYGISINTVDGTPAITVRELAAEIYRAMLSLDKTKKDKRKADLLQNHTRSVQMDCMNSKPREPTKCKSLPTRPQHKE